MSLGVNDETLCIYMVKRGIGQATYILPICLLNNVAQCCAKKRVYDRYLHRQGRYVPFTGDLHLYIVCCENT
jgi:hypothetical protein